MNHSLSCVFAGASIIQAKKVSEAHKKSTTEPFGKIKELPKAITGLVRNPTFFFLNMGAATEGLIISGFAAFLPKLIENQFSVTPTWSALLMGKFNDF